MACPYFVPREIVNDGSWLHPSRLPLGAGWSGRCCASEQETTPSDAVLHELCNLLPQPRGGGRVACTTIAQGALVHTEYSRVRQRPVSVRDRPPCPPGPHQPDPACLASVPGHDVNRLRQTIPACRSDLTVELASFINHLFSDRFLPVLIIWVRPARASPVPRNTMLLADFSASSIAPSPVAP